jgi:NAD(P)-dependent dehydrogenase (short-subunit alcohol dehydrogenase family)
MTDLGGKVAIVTGGGQGIGKSVAQALVAAGAQVVITGRVQAKLEATAELIAAGENLAYVACDAGTREGAGRAVGLAVEKFGRLDVLVNNAQTMFPNTAFEDITDEMIALSLQSGVVGTIYHMQAAFPHLKASGQGSVINFGSREGIFGGLGFGPYAASKEGIRAVTRVSAREWGKHNIRVNVICPGALSDAAIAYFQEHPEKEDIYRRDITLGRFGDPLNDIAPVVTFLASNDSRYVTGQTINVDGGQILL